MRIARRVSLLLLVAACDELPRRVAPPPPDYRPEVTGSVDEAMCLLGYSAAPLRSLLSGHQTVTGRINGEPATFVVDTGANFSVVDTGHAKAFGLAPQRGATGVAVGLGGGMRAGRARLDSLSLGDIAIRQRHILTSDLSQLERLLSPLSPEPIHGIIGQDVLREHRAVIDVARPMLYLQRDDVDARPVGTAACGPARRTTTAE